MLLRRVIEHLKVQNWTAVLLDFFIVVFGVSIGIQAANWNEERLAREDRATSLDRLHSEAELSVAFLRSAIEQYQRTVDARASVLRHAADGNFDAIDQEEIVLSINYLGLYPAVAPPRSVYDEVISAGQFRNLGDARVRDAITKYYSQLGNLSSYMSYARDLSDTASILYHPAVNKAFDPEDFTTQTHTEVDIEKAIGDPHFVKALQIGHGMQVYSMRHWEATLAVAEQMCEEIARYLARSCSTIEFGSTPVEQE